MFSGYEIYVVLDATRGVAEATSEAAMAEMKRLGEREDHNFHIHVHVHKYYLFYEPVAISDIYGKY